MMEWKWHMKRKGWGKSEQKNKYEQVTVIQEEQGLKVTAAAFTGRRKETESATIR